VGLLFFLAFFTIFGTLWGFWNAREDKKDWTYDVLKQRYARVRNDLVNQLKTDDLDKDTLRTLLESIRVIDEVVENTVILHNFRSFVSNFVFSKAGFAKKSIAEQQLLELLSSNDLFVQSARLRTA
jgi:hypothetical protein